MVGSINSAAGSVCIVAEQLDGRLLTVSLQLIGQAGRLADELGTVVDAILLGEGIAELVHELFAVGADRVYLGDHPNLKPYNSMLYSELISGLAQKQRVEIMLFGSTSMGRELAPLVASRLKTGLTAHCIDLVLNEEGILEHIIPAYGGLVSIICPTRRPQMATVAKGVFPTPLPDETRTGKLVLLEVPENLPQAIKTLEIVREEPKGVPLESASLIVAGGAGTGDLVGWRMIVDLASILGAALGSTRPAVDEGWAELETMIGQSGKMVNPQLYIGVGISGELQHMVGIMDAQVMVAINKDANAPIFAQVDYGIVDDCKEFVPLLIQKIKEHRSV
jgi:electron transfer flavoprotein alpha subunit